MKDGVPAEDAVAAVTMADPGRDTRQVSALAVNGGVETGHVAAQNQASVGVPSAMARALTK